MLENLNNIKNSFLKECKEPVDKINIITSSFQKYPQKKK
jgi:hypothetical protein